MKLGRLNHIGVATPDLDASIAFYRDVMGATDVTEPFVLHDGRLRVPDGPGIGVAPVPDVLSRLTTSVERVRPD